MTEKFAPTSRLGVGLVDLVIRVLATNLSYHLQQPIQAEEQKSRKRGYKTPVLVKGTVVTK